MRATCVRSGCRSGNHPDPTPYSKNRWPLEPGPGCGRGTVALAAASFAARPCSRRRADRAVGAMLRGRRCRPLRPLRLRSIAPMGSRSLRLRSRAGEERRAAGTPQIARAHARRGPRNVPQAPFAAPGLSPWRAGTLGINSPSRPPWLTSPPHSGGHAPLPRRRCKIWIPLHGIILPASRGWASRARRRSRQGPAAPLRGLSRQSPEDGTPLRGRSCRARAVPFGTLAQGAKVAAPALSDRGRSRARLGPSRGRAPSRPGCRAA